MLWLARFFMQNKKKGCAKLQKNALKREIIMVDAFADRGEKKLKDAPPPPLPFAKHIKGAQAEPPSSKEVSALAHKEGPLTLGEAAILMKDMELKMADLKEKLKELYDKRGLSPDYIRTYINNPSHFSEKEWKMVNEKRAEILAQLGLPQKLKEKYASAGAGGEKPYEKPTGSEGKGRERKKLGGARRGWLPMR